MIVFAYERLKYQEVLGDIAPAVTILLLDVVKKALSTVLERMKRICTACDFQESFEDVGKCLA